MEPLYLVNQILMLNIIDLQSFNIIRHNIDQIKNRQVKNILNSKQISQQTKNHQTNILFTKIT